VQRLTTWYKRAVLRRPKSCLVAAALISAAFAGGVPQFEIETSGDALLFEADEKLAFYQAVRARYGSDDYLILTYEPREQRLFSDGSLERLRQLRDDARSVDGISRVLSILDVPLFHSAAGEDRANGSTRLLDKDTNRDAARRELVSSPLYRDRLIGEDGDITALQLMLVQRSAYADLLDERARLREQRLDGTLEAAERRRLDALGKRIADERRAQQALTAQAVSDVRALMSQYADHADLNLSGLPMINADILSFIENDFLIFGGGLAVMLIALLSITFRRLRWVLLPLCTSLLVLGSMVGLLGFLGWPVTVVSSNFVALLLILTLSLNVHLAVRYRELMVADPDAGQRRLVEGMLDSKMRPAALTTLSTMVAFASLIVSDVQPVIDFGRMMVLGLGLAFALTLLVLPASLMVLGKGQAPGTERWADAAVGLLATPASRHPGLLFAASAIVTLLSAWGFGRISLDNRFIDYFAPSTEIHRGMTVIDRRLGGTTPLDVVVDAPSTGSAGADGSQDPLAGLPGEAGFASRSYWYDAARLDTLRAMHEFVERQPAVGKVISLHSTVSVFRKLSGEGTALDNYTLSVIHSRLDEDERQALFRPYVSADGDQLRIAARIHETREELDRTALLDAIREHFIDDLALEPENVRLTGLFVLYNSVLEGLLRSQLATAAFVVVALLVIFALVFGSLRVATLALIPNLLGAAVVLALMGAMAVPLDIMTISIAAVAMGIGVDDTIHYVHRYREEFRATGDYGNAMMRSHRGVGRAILYTTLIIVLGFSVLGLSNFVPTVFFGLLTGLAMTLALVADLTLLPALLARFSAFGAPREGTPAEASNE